MDAVPHHWLLIYLFQPHVQQFHLLNLKFKLWNTKPRKRGEITLKENGIPTQIAKTSPPHWTVTTWHLKNITRLQLTTFRHTSGNGTHFFVVYWIKKLKKQWIKEDVVYLASKLREVLSTGFEWERWREVVEEKKKMERKLESSYSGSKTWKDNRFSIVSWKPMNHTLVSMIQNIQNIFISKVWFVYEHCCFQTLGLTSYLKLAQFSPDVKPI